MQRDIGLADHRLLPELADLAGGALHLRHQEIDEGDGVAGPGEGMGAGAADAAGAARHDGNFLRCCVGHIRLR